MLFIASKCFLSQVSQMRKRTGNSGWFISYDCWWCFMCSLLLSLPRALSLYFCVGLFSNNAELSSIRL